MSATAAVALAVGCASLRPTSVRPFGPGDSLESNEGLLVLQVRTELRLRSISISGASLPYEVGRGTHLSLIAVSAGWHRWSGLGVLANPDYPRDSETIQLTFPSASDLQFRVEPGRLNYPGMLELYDHGSRLVSMRSVDRTALALEELTEQFPRFVAQYPIVYSGPGRNVFLDRYLAAKSAGIGTSQPGGSSPR
jgi:hypothetical protein